MKVELHLHTSRYSACAQATPAELMERIVQLGYEAVYITEHDAVWSDWEIEQLQQGFPDIRIYPGLELSVGPGALKHVLILGTTDPGYLKLTDAADALGKARDEGLLTVLAHPFRWEGGAEMLKAGVLPDAIEYRAGNHRHPKRTEMSEVAAREFGLALVNSGDTHGLESLNRFWIETDRPIRRAGDIRAVVLNGAYVNRSEDEQS